MLTQILSKIKSWLKSPSYGSELERYIISHNPKSTTEVEFLTREFDSKLSQGKIS